MSPFPAYMPAQIRDLYETVGQCDRHIDESDLIIFRLMGATFEYNSIEFGDSSPDDESTESDAS